jgi:hydroxymethylpyrimidine/phosphomethylpyrimidine kinase
LAKINSVLKDINVKSVKTGMLYDADTIRVVARALKAHYRDALPPIVCDPVCVSTSGHMLLQPRAIAVMAQELIPLTTLITPNKHEAEILLSQGAPAANIANLEDMISASRQLLFWGSHAVLLKGGHITVAESDISHVVSRYPDISIQRQGLPHENVEILKSHGSLLPCDRLVVDVLNESLGQVTLFVRPWLESKNTHGTGCTLSSALACGLACGLNRKRQV